VVALVVLAVARPAGATALVGNSAHAASDALTWWKAAIMGIVEGLTEYLPISSTGHLLVTARLLGLPHEKGTAGLDAVNTYAVAIQFGAILAVLGVFWGRFVEMVQGLVGRNPAGRRLLINLVIAFLPSAILGLALDKKIEDTLFGPWPVVISWIVGGIGILVFDRYHDGELLRKGQAGIADLTNRQALWIGIAQCLALWPGTSRSLATIIAALLVGTSMAAAVEFSFLLGFATLSAATGYKLVKDGGNLVDQFGVVDPLIGAAFAFVSAVLSIRWLVSYLKRHDLTIFAWYRFAVAALTIALLASSVI
jgi:undecaprenyl-diphosphatase